MKKIIRLTESDLIKLVKRVINEQKKFINQDKVDSILDKINKTGMDSLSDTDKQILDKPDDDWSDLDTDEEKEGETPNEDVQKVVRTLEELGWIEPETVNVYNDHFEVYSIVGEEFDYFELGNYLIIDVEDDDQGDINIYIRGEDYGEEEDIESKGILNDYLIDNWGDILASKNIELFVDDTDEYSN